MITKLVLKNFRRFDNATIEFQHGLNVIVGDNESGKSTLLEAISLCLTRRWNGRYFESEFSHYFITASTVAAYIDAAKANQAPKPPELIVEVYLENEAKLANLRGTNNSFHENVPGYRLSAALDPDFRDDYVEFLSHPEEITTVPTEFYRVDWTSFKGQPLNFRSSQVRALLIDASRIRLTSGTDYHLQKIIDGTLNSKTRARLARRYRLHQEQFRHDSSIVEINSTAKDMSSAISKKEFTLEIDTSATNGWESALAPHLDRLPFNFSGSGEQNRLKILLALARGVDHSHVILVEEPENHLSFPNLNDLIEQISSNAVGRQIVIATHSSLVVNKLGLNQLMLLSREGLGRIGKLPEGTETYFKKLAGYDTLRLVLAEKAVLVEGPSDELIFQRAYLDQVRRRPIEDGVDVISVRGLSATRFLDLAIPLRRQCVVLADNDGDYFRKVDERYNEYASYDFIHIARSEDDNRPSLEHQLIGSCGREQVNRILNKDFSSDDQLLQYMVRHKTDVALAFHGKPNDVEVVWPEYILEAIDAVQQ